MRSCRAGTTVQVRGENFEDSDTLLCRVDGVDQMDSGMDVEKSKLMEIVKFDEEKEEEKTLFVTEDTKAEVVITDNHHL